MCGVLRSLAIFMVSAAAVAACSFTVVPVQGHFTVLQFGFILRPPQVVADAEFLRIYMVRARARERTHILWVGGEAGGGALGAVAVAVAVAVDVDVDSI